MKETKVLLYGNLEKAYGKEFNFYGINTVIDVIDALSANFDTFRTAVLNNKKYHIYIDDIDIDKTELELNISNKVIKIVPVLMAASGGWGKVILGTALVVGAMFLPGGGPIAAGIFKIGIGLMLSGFAELIFSPPEETPDEDDSSYLFSGAVNIAKEGVPVPIGYGRLRVGSTNISSYLRNYNTSLYGGD